MDSSWTTTPPCGGCMARKEIQTEECGLTITLSSSESLILHIYKIFQPEQVCDYRCNCCGQHSSTEHPAVRQRFLRSLPRYLKISTTAPLTSAAQPPDYHSHGSLRDYEMLDLSQLTPQPQRRASQYALRAAIMYSRKPGHISVALLQSLSAITLAE
jgi:hypothetical protein